MADDIKVNEETVEITTTVKKDEYKQQLLNRKAFLQKQLDTVNAQLDAIGE